MLRGEIWWADLPDAGSAEPAYRRPVMIVQSDVFTRSRLATVIAVAITTNLHLADAPGNVRVDRRHSGLARDSVVNVSQLITVSKSDLTEKISRVPPRTMAMIDDGLRLVLSL